MNLFDDKRDVDTLSSIKIPEMSEDDLLVWIMIINESGKSFKKKIVQIEHVSNYYFSFDLIPFNDFLKTERYDFYKKYKLLLD